MTASPETDARRVIGRSPDRLTIKERFELAGRFIALRLYTPRTIPFHRIEAIGRSTQECIRQLQSRSLDPANFEFVLVTPPY